MSASAWSPLRTDAVEFLKPVSVGDDVSVFCELEDEGETSIAVRIEVWARVRTGDAPHKVTEGVFRSSLSKTTVNRLPRAEPTSGSKLPFGG